MHIHFNSILLLGTYLIEIFVCLLKDICTRMFITALFALGKNLKQPKWPYNTVCYTSFYFYFCHWVGANCHLVVFFLRMRLLFIYLWLCWVFVSVRGLSLVAASGGHSSSQCTGLSLSRPLLLRSTGSRRAGSSIVAHGPSCSAACGIFPDQGSNPCSLH